MKLRSFHPRSALLAATFLATAGAAGQVPSFAAPAKARMAAEIVAAAPASAWHPIAPEDLLLIELDGGRRVVIELAPQFAPVHVANIRALARAGWWNDATISRVQDNWVTQWGDWTEKKPLPPLASTPAEYQRPLAGLGFVPFPQRDVYAPQVGHVGDLPAAADPGQGLAWAAHCYGTVGVARDLNPDTGTGAELYAVLGPARELDRNIAVVGRVIDGMPFLAGLPRGTAEMGMYDQAEQRVPIRRAVIVADLPASDQPRFEVMDPASPSFAELLRARINRRDDFILQPPGASDLCATKVPVRPAKSL